MPTATAHYKKSPIARPHKEVQELADLERDDAPALVFDDNDDFEIPAEPPDDGGGVRYLGRLSRLL